MEVGAWAATLLCVRSLDVAAWAYRSVYSGRVSESCARWREEVGAVHGIAQHPWCATYDLAGGCRVGGPVITDNGDGDARLVQGGQ